MKNIRLQIIFILLIGLSSCSYRNTRRTPSNIVENQISIQKYLIKNKVLEQKANQKEEFTPRTLLLEFVDIPFTEQKEEILKIFPNAKISKFDQIDTPYFKRLYRLDFKATDEIEIKLKQALEELPFINNVERDYPAEFYSIEINPNAQKILNDSFALFQWGLINNGQSTLKDVDDIHLETLKGKKGIDVGIEEEIFKIDPKMKQEIIVAVLDSGIDIDHPDLTNNIFKNEIECNEKGKPPFKPTEDKDNNGYVGDCIGWNFTSSTKGGDNKVIDFNGHGTHISGIIAAESNNNLGVSGMSNKIKILPIKVLGDNEQRRNPNGSLTTRIAKGILYATKMGAKVINMSLGWPILLDTKYLRESFLEAQRAGVTIVAAAGNNNNNSPVFPCAYPNVICVGAISINGEISNFSNYGGFVNILAPGDDILSTYPLVKDPDLFSVKGYEIKNGTSQASPYVAGSVAILKGIYPEISEDEIKLRLYLGTKKIDEYFENTKYSNFGLIDLSRTLSVEEKELVLPEFKNLSNIIINPQTNSFKYTLNIKNYGKEVENVTVHLKSKNQNVKLKQIEYEIAKIDTSKSFPLIIEGEILNTSKDNIINLEVGIELFGLKTNYYKNEFRVSQDMKNDKRIMTYPIEELENLPPAQLSQGRIRGLIRTVGDPLLYKDYPEYYLEKDIKDKGLEIYLYKIKDEGLRKEITLEIPKASQKLFIQIMDLNFDGVPDYLVGSIANEGSERYLQLSFFDQFGNPLYRKYSHWKIDNAVAFIEDLKKVAVIPYDLEGYGKVGTLTFFNHKCSPARCNLGITPIDDQDPDPWKEKDYSKGKHFFFIKPIIEGVNVKSEVRVVDSFSWKESLKKELKLSWNDNINVLDLLPQSKEEQRKGISRGILSVGKNFFTKSYTVAINTKGILSYSAINEARVKVEGNNTVPVINLTNVPIINSATSFSGLYDETTIRFSHLTGIEKTIDNVIDDKNTFEVIKIKSKRNGKCITSDKNSNKIFQFSCETDRPDKGIEWGLEKLSNGNVLLKDDGKCMTARNYKWYRSWDSYIYKDKCDKREEQQFELIENKGSYLIRSVKTNKCLSPSTILSKDLYDILQKNCIAIERIKWVVEKSTKNRGNGLDHIISGNSYQFTNTVLFKEKNKRDHFIRLISSYKKGNLQYNLIETKSNLKVHIYDTITENSKVLSKGINRVSFLPGSIFSESLFPIFIGGKNDKRPALYIDATQISRNDIYVMTLDEEQNLVSPTKYNIRVTPNCIPMNPVPMGSDKIMNFTLLCHEKTSTGTLWLVKYLKVE